MGETPELLACPFCGAPAIVAELMPDCNDPYVYCSDDNCGVCGPGFPGGGNTRDQAVEAWNRRTPPNPEPEDVK